MNCADGPYAVLAAANNKALTYLSRRMKVQNYID